ncbi:AlpA family phage regulatory protein [Janthinobacterium fluminis]|uniref:AlpA family phage regulatory protein n=1 Tax=Janthinobacterium fluminis TaxID=2987524 RepID=A0ABT5K237_9BURK|nr:AlpA family phage regulatory protein [Janthinobacterium fluminis]MDC8759052.1 AlpA family phage regulatory protein [Janthinobacterium fluminis]
MSTTKKFLRLPAVIDATGQSRSTILRAVKAGKFPSPVHIDPHAIASDSTNVSKWQKRLHRSQKAPRLLISGGAKASFMRQKKL